MNAVLLLVIVALMGLGVLLLAGILVFAVLAARRGAADSSPRPDEETPTQRPE